MGFRYFLIFSFLIPPLTYGLSSKKPAGLKHIKKVLKKYYNQNVLMKVEKRLHLPFIKKVKKEVSSLYLGKNQFRLQTHSLPQSLIIFDGKHLWYQADIEEKTVFKSEATHPYFYLFSGLFNSDQFFKNFKIVRFQNKDPHYIYTLKPLKDMKGIKNITLKVGNHIESLNVFWNDLENSQTYKFHKPWFKKRFSKSLFIFKKKNFTVIQKDNIL